MKKNGLFIGGILLCLTIGVGIFSFNTNKNDEQRTDEATNVKTDIVVEENHSAEDIYSDSVNEDPQNTFLIKNETPEQISYERTKKNVYLFWGNGCPHCESEMAFFEELLPDYQDKITIYAFEVWQNEENATWLDKIAEELGVESTSVPYLVIGKNVIKGFGSSTSEKIKTQLDAYIASDEKDIFTILNEE